MAKYLVVVPHYTADSPSLLKLVRSLMGHDPEATFVSLTPARVPSTLAHVAAGIPDDRWEAARKRAQRTRRRLEATGARVLATRVGSWDPLQAIEAELYYDDDYTGVVISTLPHRLARLPARVARRHPDLQVVHVIAPGNFYRQRTELGSPDDALAATGSHEPCADGAGQRTT